MFHGPTSSLKRSTAARGAGTCPGGRFDGRRRLMPQQTWRRAAGVLAPFIVATAGAVAAGAEVPAAQPADRNPGAGRLSGDAARMYGFVKTPHPGELKWRQIPWLTDLREGMRQARAERRPLLLFVSGDEPLEKC